MTFSQLVSTLAIFLRWLALSFKTANFECQYLNAILQKAYYNGNGLANYRFWYCVSVLCIYNRVSSC